MEIRVDCHKYIFHYRGENITLREEKWLISPEIIFTFDANCIFLLFEQKVVHEKNNGCVDQKIVKYGTIFIFGFSNQFLITLTYAISFISAAIRSLKKCIFEATNR